MFGSDDDRLIKKVHDIFDRQVAKYFEEMMKPFFGGSVMMTFKEKVQSDLEVYKRVLEKLKYYGCDEKAIAIVSGMIEGCENVLEGLKNGK